MLKLILGLLLMTFGTSMIVHAVAPIIGGNFNAIMAVMLVFIPVIIAAYYAVKDMFTHKHRNIRIS